MFYPEPVDVLSFWSVPSKYLLLSSVYYSRFSAYLVNKPKLKSIVIYISGILHVSPKYIDWWNKVIVYKGM